MKTTETCKETRSNEEIKQTMINTMFSFPDTSEPNAMILINDMFYKMSGSMLQLAIWLKEYFKEHGSDDPENIEEHCIDGILGLTVASVDLLGDFLENAIEMTEDMGILGAFDLDCALESANKMPIMQRPLEVFDYNPSNLEIFKELLENPDLIFKN